MRKQRPYSARFLAVCALCTTAIVPTVVGASSASGAGGLAGEAAAAGTRAEAENPRASAGTPHGGPVSESGTPSGSEPTGTPATKSTEPATPAAPGADTPGSPSHEAADKPGHLTAPGGTPSSGLSGTASSSSPTSASGQSAAAQSNSGTPSSSSTSSGASGGSANSSTPASGHGGAGTSAAGGLHGTTAHGSHHHSNRPSHSGGGAAALSGTPLRGGVSAAGTGPAGAAASLAAAAAASHAAAAAAAHGQHPASTHKAGGIEPAIRTVEHIAGVVPESIWLMMAVLAVLSAMLGIRSWLTSLSARRLERQRRLLADEVGTLQAALLPAIPERLGPVRTSVAYRPAEGPAAGGDFYDVFALTDGRLAVIMGDVSGHGPTALPQTALLRYTLRTHLDSGLSPRAALRTSAGMLDHQLEGSFATAVLALLDPVERTLTYACAGHPPPLVVGSDSHPATYAAASPPIGTGLPTGMRQTVLSLPHATQICFFTDGVIEARDDGELLGADRLKRSLAALGADATAPALLERVVRETDSRPDDMAACVLQIDGPATSAPDGASAIGFLCEEMEIDNKELAGERPERFLTACGLAPSRVAEALDAARVVMGCDGAAILRVHAPEHADGLPEVEVVPSSARVMHMSDLRHRSADLHPATSG